jgi:hypothetical protein
LSSLAYGKSKDLPPFRAAHSGFHCLRQVTPISTYTGSQKTSPITRPRAA